MFDTEILSLSLTGAGQASIFNSQTGMFDVFNVMMDVQGASGRRHLGGIRADPMPGGQFQVDSFFDVFVDVMLTDPQGGGPLASFFDVFIHLQGRASVPGARNGNPAG